MILPLIQIFHLLYLWVLEFIPNPEFFIYPYLALHGWLPYRQIIDQHFPGLQLLPFNLATLGFTGPASFKILLLLVVLIESVLLFQIARKLFPRTLIPFYSALFFAIWQPFFAGSNLWIDLFLPLFTLPAFYFTVRKNWLLTGIFLGLGLLFKQNIILLVFIPVYYIFRSADCWRKLLDYIFGILIFWVPVILFLQMHHLIPEFYYWTVIFNLTIYPAMSGLLPKLPDLIRISFPVFLFLLLIIKLWKTQKFIPLIIIWSLFSVITSFSRYDLNHFQPAIPFFCLGLGLLLTSFRGYFKYLLILSSVFWSLFLSFHHQRLLQTAFFDTVNSQLVKFVKSITKPGDTIFILGGQPLVYQETQTFPPRKYFSFPLPWYYHVNQITILESLFSDPPKLIIFDTTSSVDGKNISVYAPILIEYIKSQYHQINQIGSDIIYLPISYENRN